MITRDFNSQFGIGEHVWARRFDESGNPTSTADSGRIAAVKFTNYGKVLYDVDLDSPADQPASTAFSLPSEQLEVCASPYFDGAMAPKQVAPSPAPVAAYRGH